MKDVITLYASPQPKGLRREGPLVPPSSAKAAWVKVTI